MVDLLNHYNEFKKDFKAFFRNTYIFNQGDTESSKNSFFFLLPLFIGVDLIGGLNFGNMYRVTLVFGLLSVVVLFLFLKRHWNTRVAFFSCLFYGFSPWFQELFRSETYHGPTVLIAILIIYATFNFTENENTAHDIVSPFILGILIGISFYYYGLIRGAFFFVSLVFLIAPGNKGRIFLYFFLGIFLVLFWGVYLRIKGGGAFFDGANFLTVSKPWISLLKRNFYILRQIFLSDVAQATPSRFASHSRLLNPFLFLPFILGFFYSIRQKEKKYVLFNIFSLIAYLSILITSNYQVRRMLLLSIPIYVFTGIGISNIYTYLEKIKDINLRSKARILFAVAIIFIIFTNLLYIQKNIFIPDRTFGFLRVAQAIKKHNIQGEVILLMGDPRRNINEVEDDLFIKIENYEKFAEGKMNIRTIACSSLPEILSGKIFSTYCLIITPFCEEEYVQDCIQKYGFNVNYEEKINVPPPLKRLTAEKKYELKNDYFKMIIVKKIINNE